MSDSFTFAQPYPCLQDAVVETLKNLQAVFGFSTWAATRTIGDDWIMLSTLGVEESLLKPGDVLNWNDSICSRMVKGGGPMVVPDVNAVEAYRDAPVRDQFEINAYVGAPIFDVDGRLFGTLCAVDGNCQSVDVETAQQVIVHCARVLSMLVQLEERKHMDQVYADNVKAYGMIDLDTGLPNPYAWEFLVEREEERCRQLGSPVVVVVLSFEGERQISQMRQSATLLTGVLRAEDVIARISEHEIALLMRGTSAPSADVAGMRVRASLLANGIDCTIGWAARHPSKGLLVAIENAVWRCMNLAAKRSG